MIIMKSMLNRVFYLVCTLGLTMSQVVLADVYNIVDYSTTDMRKLTDPNYGKNLPMLTYLGVANTLSKFDRDVSSCNVAIERVASSVLRFSVLVKGSASVLNALLLKGAEENVAVRYVNSSSWIQYGSVGANKSISVTLYAKNRISGVVLTAGEEGYVDMDIQEFMAGQKNALPTKINATCSGFDSAATSFTIPDEMLTALKKISAR